MGSSMLRGEDMTLCQLYLQTEAAYDVVSQIGELGIVQFKDLNTNVNAFHKKFVGQIRRAEEMERQLNFFDAELEKDKVLIVDDSCNPLAPDPKYMVDLEAQFEQHENDLKELGRSISALKENYGELTELQYVLRHADDFLMESGFNILGVGGDDDHRSSSAPYQGQYEMDSFGQRPAPGEGIDPEQIHVHGSVGYTCGVIGRERLNGFLRMLWFACRGNVFVRHSDIDDAIENPHDGEPEYKTSFMVLYQGDQLKDKVKKICDGFKAKIYPMPMKEDERQEMKLGVNTRLQDLELVIAQSGEQRHRVLVDIAKNLREWHIKTMKIKAIYYTLNMFSAEGKNYVAECWIPISELGHLQTVVDRAGDNSGLSAPSLVHPIQSPDSTLPTYHRTNKFTSAFQVIIDAYGVASYKEINPAPFAVISFPFLFAVMFGDFGHACLMLLFALFLVIQEKKLERIAETNDLFGPIFYGRYIILLMSMFSIYTGLIYNDAFSKSLNIFGSRWNIIYDDDWIATHEKLQLDANDSDVYAGSPYPFGMDPIWQISLNKITWTNSFKEKMSVIVGVSQMLLGVILSLCNQIYFKRWLNIVCEFIPMLLFLLGIFGYLCSLIISKWILFGAADSNCAPDILIGFINMFLMKYPDETDPTVTVRCSEKLWFPGQKLLQIILIVTAVVSAIWMLLSKPLYLRYKNKHRTLIVDNIQADDDSAGTPDSTHDEAGLVTQGTEEAFEFGEVFIHQAIHTIEFCLGCVSHTASYLRLWALSLAHSQLSEVLWNMVLRLGLKHNAYWAIVLLFPLFAFWAVATVVILLGMEGLSAFLHTLRLHWVEFQSKFYQAEGFAFEPYHFRDILKEAPRA